MEICSCTGCTKYITLQIYAKKYFIQNQLNQKETSFSFNSNIILSGWAAGNDVFIQVPC